MDYFSAFQFVRPVRERKFYSKNFFIYYFG